MRVPNGMPIASTWTRRLIFYGTFAVNGFIWAVIASHSGSMIWTLASRFGYNKPQGFVILGLIPCAALVTSVGLPIWLYRCGRFGLAIASIALMLVLCRAWLWYPKWI